MLIIQSDKKNSASRQLLVIPSGSVTRLIAFADQNSKLPPLPECFLRQESTNKNIFVALLVCRKLLLSVTYPSAVFLSISHLREFLYHIFLACNFLTEY